MAQTHFLPLPNTDLISSFSFNYYGNRIAVSSLDHHIYVLCSDPRTGNWPQDLPSSSTQEEETRLQSRKSHNNDPHLQSWTAHEGPVLKVVWSEPPHEEILASAGSDGTIRIWEEHTRRHPSSSTHAGHSRSKEVNGPPSSKTSLETDASLTTQWRQQALLADIHGQVCDLAFSPSEISLKLASISTDHHLRIYECLESYSPVSDTWNMIININLSSLPITLCTSTNHLNPIVQASTTDGSRPFRQHPAFTSVRGFDPSASLNRQKQGMSSNHRSLTSPLSGLRAAATPTLSSLNAAANPQGSSNPSPSQVDSHGGWSLTWCPETYWGDIFAVSAGSSDLIRIIKLTTHAQWENIANLDPQTASRSGEAEPDTGSQSLVNSHLERSPIASLAWAPPCGRSHHSIAAGHRDGRVRIWKLKPPNFNAMQSSTTSNQWEVELDAELEDHIIKKPLRHRDGSGGSGIGKCDWNVMGTVLSTSGSDSKVRIWKRDYNSRWISTGEISCGTENDEENQEMGNPTT